MEWVWGTLTNSPVLFRYLVGTLDQSSPLLVEVLHDAVVGVIADEPVLSLYSHCSVCTLCKGL